MSGWSDRKDLRTRLTRKIKKDLESNSGLLPVPPMDGAAGCRVGYTLT